MPCVDKHNFHVALSLNRHFCETFANFGLILKIYRATAANVTYFHLNSYDSRATFIRLVLFSRQIVARFSQDCRATVVRLSRDIRTSVANILHCKFAKISRRQVHVTRTNVERPSHDCRATVLRNILEKKNRIKFFNMLKNCATSSRLVRDTRKFSRHSHECRTKVPRQNSQNSREKFACH